MKYFLITFVMAATLGCLSSWAEDVELNVPASQLFVPVGYDDNDQVEIVVEGYLPDSCHKLGWVEVSKDFDKNTVDLRIIAWKVDETCLDIKVPFTHTVRLGRIGEGKYQVRLRSQELSRNLSVEKASKGQPDEFLYAPVDSARVASLLPKPGSIAVIEGRFTNTCLKVKEVKVLNHEETIEVLPLMELTALDPKGEPCRAEEKQYVVTAPLPEVKSGRHLLHVRSLNGQAVNRVYSRE